MIRNNKDIKGITIAGEEYKISQYADDTSLVTNGSLEYLNGILIKLDMFASISGLIINFTKTKMVWIGSNKFSKDVFHHSRWKLTWNNTTFDLLGIKFSVNLQEMPELNYKSKILEIEQTVKQWKSRKLTPIGRIVYKNFNCTQNESFDFNFTKPDHELIQKSDKVISGGQIYIKLRKIQSFKTTITEGLR